MSMWRLGQWGSSATIGRLYRIDEERDLHRVGHCWMHGRLHVGDVIVCVQHTGDHFYDYMLVEHGYNFVKVILNSRFGAYSMGTDLEFGFKDAEYHRLMTGDHVMIPEGSFLMKSPHNFVYHKGMDGV